MTSTRDDRERDVLDLLRQYARASERYVDAQGPARGLRRTHMHALGHAVGAQMRGKPVTAGALGSALGLSAPATTALLDRLERAGHVVRVPDRNDRRKVVVEVLPPAMETGREMFAPLGAAMREVMSDYGADELDVVARFLTDAIGATERARSDR